jgi:putative oxidoreductase
MRSAFSENSELILEAGVDFLNRLQPLALLVMRLVLGAIMIAHGYHKVFGGFHHHMDMVGSLGLPRWLAYLSAGTEFFGGIGIVLGLFTRFCSLAFAIEMGVAIWKVHYKSGLTGSNGLRISAGAGGNRVCAGLLWRRAVGI